MNVVRIVLAALCVTGPAFPGAAQDMLPDRTVGVRDRPRPEYTAPGVTAGTFRLRPTLTIGMGHTDNVFATETDTVGDRITTVGAEVDAQSQGARLPVSLHAGVESVSYADHPLEDYDDTTIGASVGYMLPRRINVALSTDLSTQHESRSEPSFPIEAVEPPELDTRALALQVSHDFASGNLAFTLNRSSLDFDDVQLIDGSVADQEFRNRDVDGYQLQANFLLSPSAGVFVRALHEDRDYDEIAGFNRDASTDALYAGAVVDLTNLMRGEIGVGVIELDNADPNQEDRRSSAFTSSLEIFLTQLMTATIRIGRSSGAADIAGVSSYIGTNASFELDYELRRNLILSARIARSERDYSGIDEQDTVDSATIGARWLLNRHARLGISYTTTSQDWRVAAVGRAYDADVVTVSASFAL